MQKIVYLKFVVDNNISDNMVTELCPSFDHNMFFCWEMILFEKKCSSVDNMVKAGGDEHEQQVEEEVVTVWI